MEPIEVYASRSDQQDPLIKINVAIGLLNHVRRDENNSPYVIATGFRMVHIPKIITRAKTHCQFIGFFDIKHPDDYDILRRAHEHYQLDAIVWIEHSTCLAHTRHIGLEWSKKHIQKGLITVDGDSKTIWRFDTLWNKLHVPQIQAYVYGLQSVTVLLGQLRKAHDEGLAVVALRECRKNLADRKTDKEGVFKDFFSPTAASRGGCNAWNLETLRELDISPYARGTKFGLNYCEDYLASSDVMDHGNLHERNQFIGVEAHRASHLDMENNARDVVWAMAATPHKERSMVNTYQRELRVHKRLHAVTMGVMEVKAREGAVVLDPVIWEPELFKAIIAIDPTLEEALNADTSA